MQGLRKFTIHSSHYNAGRLILPQRYARIASSSEDANRANVVMPGRFICQSTAGDNSMFDAVGAADTTSSGSRLLVGLVLTVCDLMGRRKDQQMLNTTESGLVVYVPVIGTTFCGLEDGDGGSISDAGGFASMIQGTPTGTDQLSQTPYFTPLPNDQIDSSSVGGGTASDRAFALIAPVGDITNTGTRRVWKFTVTPGFSTSLV